MVFLMFLLFSLGLKADQTVPLFEITKEINGNVVRYDAQLTDDCKFNQRQPVKVYWVLANGKTESLNIGERPLYTLDLEKISADQVIGQVMAFKNRNMNLNLDIQPVVTHMGCSAFVRTKIPEMKSPGLIESVKLMDFHGKSPKKVSVTERSGDGQRMTHEYKF